MIKCPNCGSTAQVKRVNEIVTANTCQMNYKCGCGTNFSNTYELNAQWIFNVNGNLIKRIDVTKNS